MFEMITRVPRDEMIEAVYEAGLRMTQRERARGLKQNGSPVTSNELAARLIAEVQEAAGKHVADLTDEELDLYIPLLSRTMFARLRAERTADPTRAEAALRSMRTEYGAPEHGEAA